MSRFEEDVAQHAGAATETASSVYVPSLQLTAGQAPPVAANGGLSYMAFDRDGDAGTAAAIEAALRQVAEGEGQVVIDRLKNASLPAPSRPSGGSGFAPGKSAWRISGRTASKRPKAAWWFPFATPSWRSRSTPLSRRTRLWRDPVRAAEAEALWEDDDSYERHCLYFPQVLRDARRIGEYYPGLSP